MNRFFRKTKKILATMTIIVIGSLVLASVQNRVVGVSAQLHPIMFVAPSMMEFGLSFPQEKRDAEFVVVAKHTYPEPFNYTIIHERKPLHLGYEGDGEDPNMPGYYRNLCPYLSEETEENEPDTPQLASLNPVGGQDLVDYWLLNFDVPTIKGYVDQGFVGVPVDAPGDYGCDVKVAFMEGTYCGDGIKQTPNDMGLGGPNNDGYEECDGSDGVLPGSTCNNNCELEPFWGPDCQPGEQESCSAGQPGICGPGIRTCQPDYTWGACVANNLPTTEVCDNGLDDDCDGDTDCDDSDCTQDPACTQPECEEGEQESCNTGLLGICATGTRTCESSGIWGSCIQNNQPTSEVCTDGLDDDCDGDLDCADSDCSQAPECTGIQPGDIVINEIMQNPDAVSDTNGEWFEVYNTTNSAIELQGCIIKDLGTDSHTIASSLSVPALGYAVLARNGDSSENGGVNADYDYSSFILDNGSDEVILICNAIEIDRVEYDDGATFPDPTGASMVLASPYLDNNIGSNWCESSSSYGDGDLGTPGTLNDSCNGECEPEAQQACDTGNSGICAAGMQTCDQYGYWGECVQDNQPTTEGCDNDLDDDCDGDTDCDDSDCTQDPACVQPECEEGQQQACNTGEAGICAAGTQTCDQGLWGECVQNEEPKAEECNGLDDDCDGQVDEGCGGGGGFTITGGGGGGACIGPGCNPNIIPPLPLQPIVLGEEGTPILFLSKVIGREFANPGDEDISYTINITNSGNLAAFNVVVTDTLPAGLSFTEDGSTTKTWNLDDLAPETSKQITYSVSVGEDVAIGIYTNTAQARADNNPLIKATADLEIREVEVLAATGFSVKELVGLISVLVSALGAALVLRKRNSQDIM